MSQKVNDRLREVKDSSAATGIGKGRYRGADWVIPVAGSPRIALASNPGGGRFVSSRVSPDDIAGGPGLGFPARAGRDS